MIKLEELGLNRYEKISSIATFNLISVSENSKLSETIEKMVEYGYRRFPVVNSKSKLKGIITSTDIIKSLIVEENLEKKVKEIMSEAIYSNYDTTIEEVITKMKIFKKGSIPLVKKEKVVSIVTEHDFIKKFNFSKEVFVKDVMVRKPFFLKEDALIIDVMKIMANVYYRRFPVLKEDKLVGIITAKDILKYFKQRNFDFNSLNHKISDVMVRNVLTVREEDSVKNVLEVMKEKGIGGFPVLKEDKLVGIITERDIIEMVE